MVRGCGALMCIVVGVWVWYCCWPVGCASDVIDVRLLAVGIW